MNQKAPVDKYTLGDLNELVQGLGDTICSLLEKSTSWWPYLQAKEEIERVLSNAGIKADEVFLEKGPVKEQVLDQALLKMGHNLEMMGRLHLN